MAKTFFDVREEAELMEKLTAADPTGQWISDFVKSDNPKFAGKSKKERIKMALGAAYAAKRQNEEIELDEAIKLNSKVVIHAPGKSYHGKVGHVGEIRNGAFKGAPKTYTVDHEGGSTQLDKKNIKLHKEEVEQIDEINLKPEHRAAIRRLRPSGEHSKTMLKHDSGKQIHVTREGDKVHLVTQEIGAGTGKKTTMNYSSFDESAWGQNKMANLKAAHDRHAEKALAANRAGDDAAVKVHQSKMNMIKTQMNQLRKEDVELDEAGGMKSSTLVKAMMKKQKKFDAMSPEKQNQQRQQYQDKKQNEAYKEPPMSAQEKLYQRHQALRKKRGLPDPEHYKRLAQQKAQEILDLKTQK